VYDTLRKVTIRVITIRGLVLSWLITKPVTSILRLE